MKSHLKCTLQVASFISYGGGPPERGGDPRIKEFIDGEIIVEHEELLIC